MRHSLFGIGERKRKSVGFDVGMFVERTSEKKNPRTLRFLRCAVRETFLDLYVVLTDKKQTTSRECEWEREGERKWKWEREKMLGFLEFLFVLVPAALLAKGKKKNERWRKAKREKERERTIGIVGGKGHHLL